MVNEPLVTILTPVYNGEKTLADAIESVLKQEYRHWRYVIVNNRSSDRTLAIAERYAAQDPRISVVTNEQFLGLIPNHNAALKHVSDDSVYIKFLQASYILYPECLREMVSLAEKHPTAGVVTSLRLLGNWVIGAGLPYPSDFMPGREIGHWALTHNPYVFGSPTNMLLRASAVRGYERFFNDENEHADEQAMYELFRKHDFCFLYKILTYSHRLAGQESSKSRKFNTVLAGRLLALRKYGPVYLSSAEYSRRLRELTRRYYRFLGMSLLQRREKAFWDKHRHYLRLMDASLEPGKLAIGVLDAIADALLNMKTVYRQVRNGTYGA